MTKLRINQKEYINTGVKDKSLKGIREFHVVFKFDSKDEAKQFTQDVKEWYSKETKDEVKEPIKKKPGPQKGQGGRPVNKNTKR